MGFSIQEWQRETKEKRGLACVKSSKERPSSRGCPTTWFLATHLWETPKEFQALGLGLAPPWRLRPFGEWTWGWKISFFSVCLPLSLTRPVKHINKSSKKARARARNPRTTWGKQAYERPETEDRELSGGTSHYLMSLLNVPVLLWRLGIS